MNLSPSHVRYCCAEHERAEVAGIAAEWNARAAHLARPEGEALH